MLCYVMLCHVMSCHMLCYVMLYYIILYYIMLYNITSHYICNDSMFALEDRSGHDSANRRQCYVQTVVLHCPGLPPR